MLFADMITMVRDVLGDPSAGFLSDTFIKSLLNLSAQDIYNRIMNVNQNFFLTSSTITWISGTQTYTLPTGCKRVVLVERTDMSTSFNLNPSDITRKNEYQNGTNIFYTPRHVYWFSGGDIGFSPLPNTSGTIKIWYIKAYVPMTASPVVEMPAEWPAENHEVVVWGAINRAARRTKEKGDLYNDIFQGLLQELLDSVAARQSQDAPHVEPPPDIDY